MEVTSSEEGRREESGPGNNDPGQIDGEQPARRSRDTVTTNTRFTRSLGAVLFWLVILQFFSALLFFGVCVNWEMPRWLPYSFTRAVHFFVGFMLIPLVLLKLATTSWKAAGYYLGRAAYRKEGPPRWYNRVLSPVMGLLFIASLWSGVAMWGSYEYLFPVPYLYHDYAVVQWHLWSSAFVAALVIFHIVAHFAETFRNRERKAKEDSANIEAPGYRVARRAAVGSFIGGAVYLAVSAAQWPWPRLSWLSKYHDGPGPLEYPVVNYFGGGTKVDASKWRLHVTGAVATPLALRYDEVLSLPSVEVELPLECVQGWRIERRWRGVPLKTLYEMAGAEAGFQSVYVHSVSGYHFTNHAYQHLRDDALLVTHVGGVQLNDEHGFPVRLLLPGLPGQNCPKWVDRLEVRMEEAPRYYSPNFYGEGSPVGGLTAPTREYLAPGSAGLAP
ncbi:MAG TPA: molybdopterin-dependent oxidoreductase [Blastocatellia bacterium]|nr:molybdopterin-dependent oxidoreductase [Blastocatellia bacterium]